MCRIKRCGNNFHIEKKMQGWASSRSQRLLRNRNALHFVYTHRLRVLCGFYFWFYRRETPAAFYVSSLFLFWFFLRIPNGADSVNYLVQCFPTVFCSSNGGLESADILVADTALLPASAINPLLRGVWCEIHLAQIPAESLSSHWKDPPWNMERSLNHKTEKK